MRLDVFLQERGYYSSRNKAREAIERGEIYVNGKLAKKPALEIFNDSEAKVEIREKSRPYVSQGGYKLEKAALEFKPEISGLTFIDAGASTGGFTDCLLRLGAKKVYCVDVGKGLLDERLASDERVVVMDETNVRYISAGNFAEEIDAAVADCSFISLEYVLPALREAVKSGGYIIALIKPQFELDRRVKMKNGIVRDKNERFNVIKRTVEFIESLSMSVLNVTEAPLKNDKNVEYLAYIFNGAGKLFDLQSCLKKLN